MRRKKGQEPPAPARADGRVTPIDVQQVEFRLAFRGYHERDVDAFLDRITEDLSFYLEENQRLRTAGATPGAPSADESRLEAEAIVARARDEAAEIVRAAEQEAAAIRAASGAATGDHRAAVAPFLNREREFLQSLGTLVQTHAEEIKEMVLAIRARAEAAAPDDGSGAPARAVPEATSPAEIRQRLGEPEPEQRTDSDTIVVEPATEPAYSSEGAPVGDGGERSLRELFWGDD